MMMMMTMTTRRRSGVDGQVRGRAASLRLIREADEPDEAT
jgi:hypothetical protein